jgi:hypothetical protein
MIILDQAPELILPAHYRDARPAIIRPGVSPDTFFPVQWDRNNRRAFVSELVKTGRIDRDEAVNIATAIPFGMFKPVAGGSPAATVTFQGAVGGTTTGVTSVTITHNGGVRTGKWVATVGSRKASAGTQTAPTNVTFCGTALTLVVAQAGSGDPRNLESIWISTTDITSDGTDNLVITWTNSSDRTMTSLYAVDNLVSTTATATASSTSGTPTLNLNVSAGGVIIAAGTNTNPTAFTWTGLTEDDDQSVGGGAEQFSTASGAFASAGTPQAVSATHGATAAACVIASFR